MSSPYIAQSQKLANCRRANDVKLKLSLISKSFSFSNSGKELTDILPSAALVFSSSPPKIQVCVKPRGLLYLFRILCICISQLTTFNKLLKLLACDGSFINNWTNFFPLSSDFYGLHLGLNCPLKFIITDDRPRLVIKCLLQISINGRSDAL